MRLTKAQKRGQQVIMTMGLRADVVRAAQGYLVAKHRRQGVKSAEQALLVATAKYNLRSQ